MSETESGASRPRVTRARTRTAGAASTDGETTAMTPVATPPSSRSIAVAAGDASGARRTEGTLHIRQGGVQEAHADAIEVEQGGIGRAYANDIAVSKGGIGLARGQQVWIEMGGAGLVVAGESRISQGGARSILARSVHVEQGGVGTVIAASVDIGKPAAVGLVIAREVRGEVRPLLDWRGALALGGVLAVVVGILRRR